MTEPPLGSGAGSDPVVASYRQLAEIYHDLLSREDPDHVLQRIVQTARRLVPVESLLVAEADTHERVLRPLIAEGSWPEGFMSTRLPFGEGLIGLAVERGRAIVSNEAHLDVRAGQVAGTPQDEPEAIISLPLVAGGVVIGAMSLYREGAGAMFSALDFELAQRFADAATLALENARTRKELVELSRRDELTGLLNRRAFNDLLATALAVHAGHESVTLVLVDLNDFKAVNDRYGHLAGDAVLQDVARRLEEAAGPHAVFRLGGDEFAVLVCGSSPACGEAVANVEGSLALFELELPSGIHRQSTSIGLASTASGRSRPDRLMREADRAMYTAKPAGGTVRALRLVAETGG
jgi:diguanylate cyclase (GGDEF)-like protein